MNMLCQTHHLPYVTGSKGQTRHYEKYTEPMHTHLIKEDFVYIERKFLYI